MTIDFGRDIRAARLARGWSRQRLAEESGLTVAAVSALESGMGGDHEPALDALELQEVHLLLPDMTAHFVRTIQPVLAKIDEAQLPVVLAAILDIVGRTAAGIDPVPDIQQVNLVTGDATVELTVSRKLA
ncbi:helix-turn-helix domain-containing protein [Mycolicibacterium fortuitum]|uniref:helix-turn-helix domain-containing protein n=1 Tax=Mycolicibacterium fortuitum TaxID=1766 RepID=UPI003AAA720F